MERLNQKLSQTLAWLAPFDGHRFTLRAGSMRCTACGLAYRLP